MNLIIILTVFCGVLIILSLMILTYISFSKARRNKYERYCRVVMEKHKDDMYNFLVHSKFTITLMPKKKYLSAFEQLLLDYKYLVATEQVTNNMKYYAEKYFTDYYREMLLGKEWSYKFNALNGIVQFKMETLTNEVKHLLSDKEVREDKLLSLLILKILIMNSEQEFFELFNTYKIELSFFQYREICKTLSDSQWKVLLSMFEQLNYEFKVSILDSISIFNKVEYEEFIQSLVADQLYYKKINIQQQIEQLNTRLVKRKNINKEDDLNRQRLIIEMKQLEDELGQTNELIIKSLKALSIIGYSYNTELDKYLFTGVWIEKLMMLRMIGKLQVMDKQDLVISSLADSNYLIRREAAQSLSALPLDSGQLHSIYEQLDDKFAKDILIDFL